MDKKTEDRLRIRRDRATEHGAERWPLEEYDRNAVLLVERRWHGDGDDVHSLHSTVATARRYHGQECNWDNWRLVKVVDLDTGVVHVPAMRQPMRLVADEDT